jgi:hypothetical protein
MIKLSYGKTNINVTKLHDEFGDLGQQYFLTHDESEFHLMFPDLFGRTEEVEGENPVNFYEKQIITFDDEANQVISFEPFDIVPIQTQINGIIAAHDPTPIPAPKTEIEILQQKLVQAEADNLTTLEALAEVYEMILSMQS